MAITEDRNGFTACQFNFFYEHCMVITYNMHGYVETLFHPAVFRREFGFPLWLWKYIFVMTLCH